MKNNSTFKDNVAPALVLGIICFVITFALAWTYGITKPIIDRNTLQAANEARTELIPDAESFEEYNGDLKVLEENKVYVTEVYTADADKGTVITVKSNSYGGLLTAMVGIDGNGTIIGVKITDAADTPGVGTKAQTSEHLNQYNGLTKLGNENIKDDSTVDNVSGASISSEAIQKAVYCALEQYDDMGGAK